MRHVEIAKRIAVRADIEKRLTGRFYTPHLIADRIAEQAFAACPNAESVGDPFCGDGRLILSWLHYASRHGATRRLRRVVLWDYDRDAVTLAKERVTAAISKLSLSGIVHVEATAGDTFNRVQNHIGAIDVVITNPPWELLKPDTRDGVDDHSGYKDHLRSYASELAGQFQGALSARGKAMTGYGVNLARAGAVASAMLVAKHGALAIVLPASIFADQASAPFRREFFTRTSVQVMEWYPAEARLFNGVDQPFVTSTALVSHATSRFALRRFGSDLRMLEQRRASVENDPSEPVALNVTGDHEKLARTLAQRHAPIAMLQADTRFGLWLGRELDETRLAESFAQAGEGIPFLKGRHVFPFSISRNDVWNIDPKKRAIPTTVKEPRIAWRDVSRPSQKRRMHVAIVPDGNVTGNSLGVAYFRYGPVERIRVLMAVMNSMAFELQVRSHLATAHVSQGVLKKCAIPLRCFEEKALYSRILQLVDGLIRSGRGLLELEVVIARAYGLRRDEFASLLDVFPKLSLEERTAQLRIW